MSAELLAELARVKAVFQLRAIEAVMGFPRNGMAPEGRRREGGSGVSALPSPVPKECAQVIDISRGTPNGSWY